MMMMVMKASVGVVVVKVVEDLQIGSFDFCLSMVLMAPVVVVVVMVKAFPPFFGARYT